jgi:hypothetical protein
LSTGDMTGEEFLAFLDTGNSDTGETDHPLLEGHFAVHLAAYEAFDEVLSALNVMMELEADKERFSFAWDVVNLVRERFDGNYYQALDAAKDLVEAERGA